VKTHLAAGTKNGVTGNAVPPAPAIALPAQTFTDAMTVALKGRKAELRHLANVHTTATPMFIYGRQCASATGDVVTFGRYPNIDYLYGGSIDARSEAWIPCCKSQR
jgi:hypothetical protein